MSVALQLSVIKQFRTISNGIRVGHKRSFCDASEIMQIYLKAMSCHSISTTCLKLIKSWHTAVENSFFVSTLLRISSDLDTPLLRGSAPVMWQRGTFMNHRHHDPCTGQRLYSCEFALPDASHFELHCVEAEPQSICPQLLRSCLCGICSRLPRIFKPHGSSRCPSLRIPLLICQRQHGVVGAADDVDDARLDRTQRRCRCSRLARIAQRLSPPRLLLLLLCGKTSCSRPAQRFR